MKLLQHLHDENEIKKEKIKELLVEQATKKATEEVKEGKGDTNVQETSSAEVSSILTTRRRYCV
jgi:phage terminase small subunit